MPARLYIDTPLNDGVELALPDAAARHAQVLRVQPGTALVLFDGSGAEWPAEVVRMGGRREVVVRTGTRVMVDRELPLQVTLAIGVPANDRMDALIEKACELGVAAIQPLICERSVLRLDGERADKRRQHWQSVAIAACEQSGRSRVPEVGKFIGLPAWLSTLTTDDGTTRWLLSPGADTRLRSLNAGARVMALSGPEGGLAPAEEAAARARGFEPISLGARVLRADTAPLALLAFLGLSLA